MDGIREVARTIKGQKTSDGAGVKLTRIIGTPELDHFDPFLLLDEFKNDNPDDYMAGFPPHPHRGFETVTYLKAGNFNHEDSRGNKGFLGPGSVQWMTAGKGIIHSEMPGQEEGLVWGYQLWLNLPGKLKMTDPKYQDIPSEKIPVVEKDGLWAKVIAGEYGGVKGAGKSHTPFTYIDVNLSPGSAFTQAAPKDQNAMVYVYEGAVEAGPAKGEQSVSAGNLALLGEGDSVRVSSKKGGKFLFISGQRLNEPVVRGGPFVMNTLGELKKAFYEYQTGVLDK